MPEKIFTASERGRLHARVLIALGNGAGGFGDEVHTYMRTLEQIAEAARNYADNSTPVNANKLNELLSKVDRMRP